MKLQSSHYRNVSTDPLVNGCISLWDPWSTLCELLACRSTTVRKMFMLYWLLYFQPTTCKKGLSIVAVKFCRFLPLVLFHNRKKNSEEIWNKSNFVGCYCKLLSYFLLLTTAMSLLKSLQDIHKNKIEWNLWIMPQANLGATPVP